MFYKLAAKVVLDLPPFVGVTDLQKQENDLEKLLASHMRPGGSTGSCSASAAWRGLL